MSTPTYLSKNRQNTSHKKKSSLLATLFALIAVAVGLALCVGIGVKAAEFTQDKSAVVAKNEAEALCKTSFASQGIKDNGGCLCISRALTESDLLSLRQRASFNQYLISLKQTPGALNGAPPSGLDISRIIGVPYGHQFLKSYSACVSNGFVSS